MKRFAVFALLSFSIELTTPACALSAASGAPQPTIKSLVQQLQQPAVAPRVAALKSLGNLHQRASVAVPAIIDTLNENRSGTSTGITLGKQISPEITDAALEALANIGTPAHDAAPYVTPLLKDRNELLRRPLVLKALNSIGPSSESAPVLMRVLGEEGKQTATRQLAIEVLGKVDPPAVEATDLLREISEDNTDPRSKAAAQKALESITHRAQQNAERAAASPEHNTLQTLRLQLEPSHSVDDRVEALDQIAELGAKAAPVVPELMHYINDSDDRVRHATLGTIAAAGSSAVVAAPGLITKFLSEHDANERGYIGRTIAKIDPSGKRTIPLLQEALNDPFKARFAIELLNELGTDQTTSIAQRARQRWRIRE